jgi:hypothetical protein
MAHLLRLTEWQGGSGVWYCADVEELGSKTACHWRHLPHLLNLSSLEFIQLLKDKYKVTQVSYSDETDTLVFSWKSQADMRLFKNGINAIARKQNYQAG